MNRDEERLDQLWAAYRQACPECEPGAEFMPRIWEGIEARRGFPALLRRFSAGFVTAALAICLAMAVAFVVPYTNTSPVYMFSYVDALNEDHAQDTLAYADLPDGDPQ